MIEDVLQRIKILVSLKSENESQFAKLIKANQKTINQQLRGERGVSLDTVLLISSAFEDVSMEWLMRGVGDIFLHEELSEPLLSAEDGSLIESLKAEINMLKGENKVLRELAGLNRCVSEKKIV